MSEPESDYITCKVCGKSVHVDGAHTCREVSVEELKQLLEDCRHAKRLYYKNSELDDKEIDRLHAEIDILTAKATELQIEIAQLNSKIAFWDEGKHICAAYCDGSCFHGTGLTAQATQDRGLLEALTEGLLSIECSCPYFDHHKQSGTCSRTVARELLTLIKTRLEK